MKPIETRYKGYRFRSRLEARWAVFFDTLGIEWEYEPEGFELSDGSRYLPDFLLRGVKYERDYGDMLALDIFVEVKPSSAIFDDWAKAKLLSHSRPTILLCGVPEVNRSYTLCGPDECSNWTGWIECTPLHGAKAVAFVSFFRSNELSLSEYSLPSGALIEEAVAAAKSARFEFGECGVAA